MTNFNSMNYEKSDTLQARLSNRMELPNWAQKRKRFVRLYLTAILLLSAMFTMYIWQSTKIVEIKLRLKNSETRISALETNNAVLRADISKFQSLSRIEKVAKSELGMIVPKRLCYIPMPNYRSNR